jgi:hypothetical protein
MVTNQNFHIYLFIYLFIHHKVYIKHLKPTTYSCPTRGEHISATEFQNMCTIKLKPKQFKPKRLCGHNKKNNNKKYNNNK